MARNYSSKKKGKKKMEKAAAEGKEALESHASGFFFLRGTRPWRKSEAFASVLYRLANHPGDSMHNLWVERKNVPSVLRAA